MKWKNCGYFPNRSLIMQTALNLKAFNKGKVGQKIHAVCLVGPTGAGKSFYAETYRRLAKNLFDEPIEFVSYQCNTSTGKAELYEEINVAAAIAGDPDKAVISGKLAEAIEMVNSGKKVILFIDEFDKSRSEVDSFFYNFLQEGEIDTNQKGKLRIKPEYVKNLQVIIGKNDERELAQPLSRRFKKIKLDYMKPDILATTMNRVLQDSNSSIRDAIILLYTGMYETLNPNSKYHFSRLPSCSECMQAVIDAEDLMEIGANKTDIVVTGICANLIKSEEDEELFQVFLQENRNNVFVDWYDRIMEAIGRNSDEDLNNLKRALAESFYPEQLRKLTREIEKTKRDLEHQKKLLEEQTSEYDARKAELEEAQEVLDSREKELENREKDTAKLRENAYEDAKQGAEQYLQIEKGKLEAAYNELADKLNNDRAQMEKDYQNQYKKLEQEKADTAKLRADAETDALTVANQTIQAEREKMNQEAQEREEILRARFEQQSQEINGKIDAVNAEIQDFNYQKAQFTSLQDELAYKEEKIKEFKRKLEELLGRKVKDSDFEQGNEENNTEGVEMQNGEKLISKGFQDFINGEIQENHFENNAESVFKYFQGNAFSVGTVVLETKANKEDFVFKDENNRYLLNGLVKNDKKTIKWKKKAEEICTDGVLLYKADKFAIVGIRVVEHTPNGEYKSIYKFFSNTLVIPIQSLNRINTFISNLNNQFCKAKLQYTSPIEMKLDCVIASSKGRKHQNGQDCIFETIEEKDVNPVYRLQYNNTIYTTMQGMAKQMQSLFNCSMKNMSEEERESIEKLAYIKHCQYILNADVMSRIEHIEIDKLYNGEVEK